MTIMKKTWNQKEVNGLTMAELRLDGFQEGKGHSENGKLMQVPCSRAVWMIAAMLTKCTLERLGE